MKKSWTMRVGVVLVALTLITSCFVGGTFAKYVTSGNGSDSARVAKFGVKVTATGNLFAKEYATDDGAVVGTIAKSVINPLDVDTKNLVAPGTKKDDITSVTITGKPEVAVSVKNVATVTLNDNWKDEADAFYCPIIITVGTDEVSGFDYDNKADFAAAIKAKIDAFSNEFPPNTDLSADATVTPTISWEWKFTGGTGSEYNQTDLNDTYLGDQAAEGNAGEIAIEVATTVTQID